VNKNNLFRLILISLLFTTVLTQTFEPISCESQKTKLIDSIDINGSFEQIKENEILKITEYSLIDDKIIQETLYLFKLRDNNELPLESIGTDLIATSKINNFFVESNGQIMILNENYRLFFETKHPEWKYIRIIKGSKKINNYFYFYLEMDKSSVMPSECSKCLEKYIAFSTKKYTPLANNEVSLKEVYLTCAYQDSWRGFVPFDNAKLSKDLSCEIIEFENYISKGGNFTELDYDVIFQKDLIEFSEYRQILDIKSKGDLIPTSSDITQNIIIQGKLFLPVGCACNPKIISKEITLNYNSDSILRCDVKYVGTDNLERTAFKKNSKEELKEYIENGGNFGYTFIEEGKLLIVGRIDGWKEFKLDVLIQKPQYKFFEEINSYTFKLGYSPLRDSQSKAQNASVIVQIPPNFYLLNTNYELVEGTGKSSNPTLEYNFNDLNNSNLWILTISNNFRKILNSIIWFNIVLSIVIIILSFLFWKIFLDRKLIMKIFHSIFGLILEVIIALISNYSRFISTKEFILDTFMYVPVILSSLSIIMIYILDKKRNKKKKKNKKNKIKGHIEQK